MYKTPLTRQEYHLMSVSSLESWGRFGLRWGDALRGGEGVRYFDTIVILPAGGATTGTEALWASGSVVGGTLERITLGWQEEGVVTVWWDTGAEHYDTRSHITKYFTENFDFFSCKTLINWSFKAISMSVDSGNMPQLSVRNVSKQWNDDNSSENSLEMALNSGQSNALFQPKLSSSRDSASANVLKIRSDLTSTNQ